MMSRGLNSQKARRNMIKECPFCGGEAEIIGGPENWNPTFYDPDSGGDPITIQCKSCGGCMGTSSYDYAEALATWNARAGWVSVDERLPEKPNYYIVCWQEVKPHYWTGEAWFDAQKKTWRTSHDHSESHEITHWQPLPSPPT
jgi:hypothetical protein